jgi:hypothetical protein
MIYVLGAFFFFLAALLWAVWRSRNAKIFRNSVGLLLIPFIFSILHLFSFWTGGSRTSTSVLHQAVHELSITRTTPPVGLEVMPASGIWRDCSSGSQCITR